MSLHPGSVVGPYEILSALGAGGMGEVWKARDTRLDRIVAIKTLKGARTAAFEQEARAIAALNHPNVCTLYDIGPTTWSWSSSTAQPLRGPVAVDDARAAGASDCQRAREPRISTACCTAI